MLVIDDDELRAMTSLVLEFAGFRVVAAASVAEAKQHTAASRPTVVVCDLRRGGTEDWMFLQQLCGGSAAGPRLVLVADTAGEVSEMLASCDAAIVPRPVDPMTLVEIVFDISGDS